MSPSLLKHSDNPFKVNGTTFGIEETRTPIPNGPTLVNYKLLEKSSEGGWNELDTWKYGEIKDEIGVDDWESKQERHDDIVAHLTQVADDYYA